VPGAQASEIALRYGLHRNQLYARRREFGAITAANAATTEPGSVPVVALSDADAAIEIEIGSAIVRVRTGRSWAFLARCCAC
jgi:transposase-like protein